MSSLVEQRSRASDNEVAWPAIPQELLGGIEEQQHALLWHESGQQADRDGARFYSDLRAGLGALDRRRWPEYMFVTRIRVYSRTLGGFRQTIADGEAQRLIVLGHPCVRTREGVAKQQTACSLLRWSSVVPDRVAAMHD
jgi:hypothetical protein